jgi:tetratricopeptide (TPR) repeat protein
MHQPSNTLRLRGHARRSWAPMALLTLAACASGLAAGGGAPQAAALPRLEAQVAQDSTDAKLLARLGAAYRTAGRMEDARTVLKRAVDRNPEESGAVLFLGLTYEDLGQFAEARDVYQKYVSIGRSASTKRDLQQRLELLRRREIQAAVRKSLESERALTASAPLQPRTVAVFPFRMISQDTALEPLTRAMAEMLATDLSQTGRLTVLERLQVQTLVDEMKLGESGLADTTTVARGGRILGAERVVQGSIDGGSDRLRLDAAVVRVAEATRVAPAPQPAQPAARSGAAPRRGSRTQPRRPADPATRAPAPQREARAVALSESDALDRIFDMEKRLALKIYGAMGIELTPAEREQINKRPTENLQAILAYGRGLRDADAGDFQSANRHFSEAISIDPGFVAAQQQAAAAAALGNASRVSTRDLARRGGREIAPTSSTVGAETLVPDPSGRDAASEVLGTEGVGRSKATVEIIVRRPAGGN